MQFGCLNMSHTCVAKKSDKRNDNEAHVRTVKGANEFERVGQTERKREREEERKERKKRE